MMATAEPLPGGHGTGVSSGPFKFLDYYGDTIEDQRRFGGRDREVREITARITTERALVLYGPSGVGKTSLLLAGVFPELRQRGYLPVYVRTLSSPILDLCRALGDALHDPALPADCDLGAMVASSTRPVAIILDQFEEFFIRFADRPQMRKEFVGAVGKLINDRSLPLTVIFSLRQDYLADLDAFREQTPSLFDNEYRLKPLTAFGVRQTVARALAESQLPFDDAVVARLVDQLEGFGFDPAALQILCSEVYRAARAREKHDTPRITAEDVLKVGSLQSIFRGYLESALEAVPTERHILVRMILDALVTRDTKRAVTVEDLLAARFNARPEELKDILDALWAQRVLRRYERDQGLWYELIHERLVPLVREWLDRDPAFSEFRRARNYVQLITENELWRQNPEALLNQDVLIKELQPFRDRFRFDRPQTELVLRSLVYRRLPLGDWIRPLSAEGCTSLIAEMMASPDARIRAGAAEAAAHTQDPDGQLAARCLEAALGDDDDAVRRAAGLALGPLAQAAQLEALRSALTETGGHRARELLVNLSAAGHPLSEFPWWRRRLARSRVARRLLREQRAAMWERRKAGLRAGIRAGLAWAATVGIVVSVVAVALSSSPTLGSEWLGEMANGIAWITLGGTVLGASFGWAAANAAASYAATRGRDRWALALQPFRAWVLLPALILAVIGLVLTLLGVPLGTLSALLIWAWLGVGAVLALAGLLARLIQPAVRAADRHRLVRSLWAGLGIPTVLGFATALLVARWTGDTQLWIVPLFGLLPSVVAYALVRAARAHPIAGESVPSSPVPAWQRRAVLMSPIITVVLFFALYGVRLAPWTADVENWDPQLGWSYTWTPRTAVGTAHYFGVRNQTGGAQLAQLASMQGPADVRLGTETLRSGNPSPPTGTMMVIPPGTHLGSVRTQDGAREPLSVTLSPARAVDDASFDLTEAEDLVRVVRLRGRPGRPLIALVRGRAAAGSEIHLYATWDGSAGPVSELFVRARDAAGRVIPPGGLRTGAAVPADGAAIVRTGAPDILSAVRYDVRWPLTVDGGGHWAAALEVLRRDEAGIATRDGRETVVVRVLAGTRGTYWDTMLPPDARDQLLSGAESWYSTK